jgi:drug/metabolite transporter (DMT)-like permease
MFQARAQNPALAASLIGIATAFIAGTTLFAKALGSDAFGPALHPLQISHGRYVFAFIALVMVAAILRPKFGTPNWRLHIVRTSFGWAGVTLMFASVAFIPLADATAISFLNPVFGMMLAIPLLGERVGPIRWSAAIIALIGAFILLRPTPDSFQIAALLPFGAAICLGFELIFIKKLSGRENPFQVLLTNNFVGVVISTIAVLPFWIAPTLAQWGILALIGMFMAVAQTCFVNAMARADASFVAPFSYATLIFATLYDLIFYDVFPDAITWLGAGIIIAGAVLLAVREAQLRRR